LIHDPDRDWNQQAVIVECALQCQLGRRSDLAADPSQRIDAFSPPPFNAAMEAQGIQTAH
jgi:hypothetical protein